MKSFIENKNFKKLINMKKTIKVNGSEIVLFEKNEKDYISLTDIAKKKNVDYPADIVKNWLKSKTTIEFL